MSLQVGIEFLTSALLSVVNMRLVAALTIQGKFTGVELTVNGSIALEVNTRAHVECANLCSRDTTCLFYQFHLLSRSNCLLIQSYVTQLETFQQSEHSKMFKKDLCEMDPCENSGICNEEANSYRCTCTTGFTGSNCETNIDDCSEDPCQSGGTCTDWVDSYTCTCVSGFTGHDCEINIDDCSGSPCQNGGTCEDGVDSYVCSCVTGYSGPHCETDLDDCSENPCQNAGTCTDGVDSYTCTCASGFIGLDCNEACSSNAWTPPSTWPAGDTPSYYHDFENTCGFVNYGAELVSGLVGTSLKTTSAESDWIEFDDTVLAACLVRVENCNNGGSVAIWIKITSCQGYHGIISSYRNTPSVTTSFYITCDSTTSLRTIVISTGGFYDAYPPIESGWFHLVMVYHSTGDGLTVYQNGVEFSTDTTPSGGYAVGTNKMVIGRFYDNLDQSYADIEVDELSFWNRELTAIEVLRLYEQHGTPIDDCSGDPCQNGGTCEDGFDSYTCTCTSGFTGTNCNEVSNNGWVSPSIWPAGDSPVYYHGFEDMDGFTNNGAELVSGLVGTSLRTTSAESDWIEFDDTVLAACLVRVDNCNNGGSVAIWIKITSCQGYHGIISSYRNNPFTATSFYMTCDSTTRMRTIVIPTGGFYDAYLPIESGWFHLVMVYHSTGDGLTVYQNGVVVSTDTSPSGGYAVGSNKLVIGRFYDNLDQNYADIEVDELSFWNRELTASEVLSLYQQYENNA